MNNDRLLGKKHVIFVFSISCEACKKDFFLWNDLIPNLQSDSCQVNGLSLDSQAETYDDIDPQLLALRKSTIIAPNKGIQRTYRVLATPTILVLSDQGVIEWVHIGRLNQDAIQELKQKINKA